MNFDLEKIFFDTPIYTRIDINDIETDEFKALFLSAYSRNIEGYNPWEKTHSTFLISRRLTYSDNNFRASGGFGTINLTCKRYHSEFQFHVYWEPKIKYLIKIGQFPAVADFHIGEIKRYNKLLPENKLKEFTKAIGLAANGVGIGSFVYLRRIFEFLITKAFDKAKQEGALSESDFKSARMNKKIDLLKLYLPEFLVENKEMYSILSLGIHELDENLCLTHFDTLKVGIEIILDEELDELRKKEKIEMAKKKLKNLKGKLTN